MIWSWPRSGGVCAAMIVALALVLAAAATEGAEAQETRPYDEKLIRLSGLLGAVHYLRELCGAEDGQLWRDRMRELLDAEGTTALRKARLTRSFNKGYQGYSRTYRTCTPSARTAIDRFLAVGGSEGGRAWRARPRSSLVSSPLGRVGGLSKVGTRVPRLERASPMPHRPPLARGPASPRNPSRKRFPGGMKRVSLRADPVGTRFPHM